MKLREKLGKKKEEEERTRLLQNISNQNNSLLDHIRKGM